MIFSQQYTLKLCGVQGCCPELSFERQGVRIADDFGGKVFLTADQWKDLSDRIERQEFPSVVA